MKFSKSKAFKDEYCATCVQIGEIFPIEGKDRIVKTFVNGLSIVIGKDEFKTGDVAVYCANEASINELFLHINSMYDDKELNMDVTKKGYINKHGRIRVIKLGGVPSFGLLLNPETIANFINEPVEQVKTFLEEHIGEDFDEINGERFIQVYMPSVKSKSQGKSRTEKKHEKLNRFKMLIEGSFRFHYDTQTLQKHMNELSPEDEVWISTKIHGSSVCLANILTNTPTPWHKRLWRKYVKHIQEYDQDYNLIYSSRNVIKNEFINPKHGSFYSDDIWGFWAEKLKGLIPKNVCVYGEIMGYTQNGSPIQKGYDYGCSLNDETKSKLMIYRMTRDNKECEIPEVIDFGLTLKEKLGNIIMAYPWLWHGKMKYLYPDVLENGHWHENVLERMKRDKRFLMEMDEPLCNNKVPREGIVLRKANDPIAEAFKLKTEKFFFRERDLIDNGEVDDEMIEGYK